MTTHAMDSPKRCEHYPLLSVCGAGGGRSPSVITALPKRSRFNRWPEIMSACWMTVVLLCICFLTLYVLGVALTKRQGLVVEYTKDRELRYQHRDSNKNVYYHHVVERGALVDFITFSNYLARMATLYPNLRFNVFFLTADPVRRASRKPKHGRLMWLFSPTIVPSSSPRMNEENAREMQRFLKAHRNVNISITPISKYMASTPLKDRWRGSPSTWIAFYARVVSVWHYGGIGVDLATANAEYLTHRRPDFRKSAVFAEHNDGSRDTVHVDTTREMMQRMQNEDLPILLYLFKFMSEIFDRAIPLFGNTTSMTLIDENRRGNEEVSETHFDKALIGSSSNSSDRKAESNVTMKEQHLKTQNNNSATPLPTKAVKNVDQNADNIETLGPDLLLKKAKAIPASVTSGKPNLSKFVPDGDFEMLPPIYLYRLSLTSDDIGPIYETDANPNHLANNQLHPEVKDRKGNYGKCALALDLNGGFVSSLSRYHPLLGHIIYANFRPMPPRSAVRDALMAHCSASGSYDNFCKYISII